MSTDDRAKEAFYVGPPAKDKLPKVLHHEVFQLSYSRLLSHLLFFPSKVGINVNVNLLSYTCRALQLDLYWLGQFHMERFLLGSIMRGKIQRRTLYTIVYHI